MTGQIALAISQNSLDDAYGRVIIGFSGGADSSALLHFIKDRAKEVVCVHVNHMIRGEEAKRDEDFCVSVCKKYGIEIAVHTVDIPALAKKHSIGLEQMAREERYRILEAERSARGFDAILTAHNADDNVESVIFNLARGSGANGISGIKPKNGKILRPLILTSREKILEYCESNQIDFVTDSTNSDTDYTRNYIRHKIVPAMRELNPSLHDSVARLGASLRQDDELLCSEASAFVNQHCKDSKLPKDKALSLHISIAVRVMKILSGENLDYKSTVSCLDFIKNGTRGGVINLCKGVSFKCEGDYFTFLKTKELARTEFYVPLKKGLNEISDIGVTVAYMCDEAPSGKSPFCTLRLKNIVGELIARSRRDGDTVKHGRVTKKVKKILSEKKIPSHLRDKIPLLCDSEGIIAIPEIITRDGCLGKNDGIVITFYK